MASPCDITSQGLRIWQRGSDQFLPLDFSRSWELRTTRVHKVLGQTGRPAFFTARCDDLKLKLGVKDKLSQANISGFCSECRGHRAMQDWEISKSNSLSLSLHESLPEWPEMGNCNME